MGDQEPKEIEAKDANTTDDGEESNEETYNESGNDVVADESKKFKCVECELSFSSTENLDNHKKIHDMEKMTAFTKDTKIIVGSKVVLDLKLKKILPGTVGILPKNIVINKDKSPKIDIKNTSPVSDAKSVVINGKTFKIIKTPESIKTSPVTKKTCETQSKHQNNPVEQFKNQDVNEKPDKIVTNTDSMQSLTEKPLSFVRMNDMPSGSTRPIKPSITDIMRRGSIGPENVERRSSSIPTKKPIIISNLPQQLHTVKLVDEYKKNNNRIVLPKLDVKSEESPHFRKVVVTKMEVPFHPSVSAPEGKSVRKKLSNIAGKTKRRIFKPNIEELLARIRKNGPQRPISSSDEGTSEETGIDINPSSEKMAIDIKVHEPSQSVKNSDDEVKSKEFAQNNVTVTKTLPNSQITVVQIPYSKVNPKSSKKTKKAKPQSLMKAIQYPENKGKSSKQQPQSLQMKAIFYPPETTQMKAIFYPSGYEKNEINTPISKAVPLHKTDSHKKIHENEKLGDHKIPKTDTLIVKTTQGKSSTIVTAQPKPIRAIFYPPGYEEHRKSLSDTEVSRQASPKSVKVNATNLEEKKSSGEKQKKSQLVRTIGHFSSLSSNIKISEQDTKDNIHKLGLVQQESEDKFNINAKNLKSSETPQLNDIHPEKKEVYKRTIDSLNEKFVGKKIKMTEFSVDDLPQEKVDLKNISILKPKKAALMGGKKVKAILVRKNGKTFVVQKKGTWASEFRKLQKKKQKELADKISKAYETEDENSVHDILLANLRCPVQGPPTKFDKVITKMDKDKKIDITIEPKITIKTEKTLEQELSCGLSPVRKEYDTFNDTQNEFIARFICHICRKKFNKQEVFDQHMANHVNEEMIFSCDICSLKFHTESMLHNHVKLHQKEKSLQCRVCPALFRHASELRLHQNLHSNLHKCASCGIFFETMAEAKAHMLAHHQNTDAYTCATCNTVCATLYELRKHAKQHVQGVAIIKIKKEKDDSYEEKRKSMSPTPNNKNKHQFGRQFIKRYTCKDCERVFTSPEIFKLHMNQHVKTGDDYKCELCEKRFLTDREFSTHVRTHKEIIDFMCPYCPKVCLNVEKLSRHISDHRREQHRCEKCGDTFQTNVELSRHYREHRTDDVKPKIKPHSADLFVKDLMNIPIQPTFKCKICLKTFIAKKGLVKHIMTHKTKDMDVRTRSPTAPAPSTSYLPIKKPTSFACEYCGRTFNEKKAHGSHIRIHIDGKFICKICSIPYKLEYNLQAHMKIHPRCRICGKAFKLNANVKQHEKECQSAFGKELKKHESPKKPFVKLEPLSDDEMDVENDTSLKSESETDFIGFNQEEVSKEKENVTEMKEKLQKIAKRSTKKNIQTEVLQMTSKKRKLSKGESLLKNQFKLQPKDDKLEGSIKMEPGLSQSTDRLLKCMLCDLVFVKQDKMSRHFTSHLLGCEVKLQKIK